MADTSPGVPQGGQVPWQQRGNSVQLSNSQIVE